MCTKLKLSYCNDKLLICLYLSYPHNFPSVALHAMLAVKNVWKVSKLKFQIKVNICLDAHIPPIKRTRRMSIVAPITMVHFVNVILTDRPHNFLRHTVC